MAPNAGREKLKSPDLARRIVATTTSASWRKIPHVSFTLELDCTELVRQYAAQKQRAAEDSRISVPLNTLIVKLIADALAPFPKLYGSFSYNRLTHRPSWRLSESVNINMPWRLPDGQMIPIIFRDVNGKSLAGFSEEVEHIRAELPDLDIDREMLFAAKRDTGRRLRSLKLSALSRVIPLELIRIAGHYKEEKDSPPLVDPDGVVVSNAGSLLGSLKGRFAMLEIIEPKIMAIGIGSIDDSAAVSSGALTVKKTLPLTIAFDHRAIDLGDIVPFMQKLSEDTANFKFE